MCPCGYFFSILIIIYSKISGLSRSPTEERLVLGVGPLVSMQHRVVGELIGAEITAVGREK